MSNDSLRIIESDGQRAYVQFGRDPDAQLDMLRNELAKLLLETHLGESEKS